MSNIKIISQYIKDLSFELPGAPQVFLNPQDKPDIALSIDIVNAVHCINYTMLDRRPIFIIKQLKLTYIMSDNKQAIAQVEAQALELPEVAIHILTRHSAQMRKPTRTKFVHHFA
jgi:preprotein translocase subunit SecB